MNITKRLTENAINLPDKKALLFPLFNKLDNSYQYQFLTFRGLESLTNKFSLQLTKMGLKKGDRTLLFLKPGFNFHAMAFALFKIGAVPIFIDPGMGRKNLFKCIKGTNAVALIAEKEVHWIRLFFPHVFKTIKFHVTTGSFSWGRMKKISTMEKEKKNFFPPVEISPDETAAILFTSGGTGIPKGVIYTQDIFDQQTNILKKLFSLTELDIDLPGFPLFSLFTISMGMTSCIPDMNPSTPALCNPQKIVQHIIDQQITFLAGSPAIWENVVDYCIKEKIVLSSVKYVVMFGAPVSTFLHKKFKPILVNGTTYTPYGATEALPLTNISGEYILNHTAAFSEIGKGTCVGPPISGNSIKIIDLSTSPVAKIASLKILPPNTIGEIIVSGPTVTREYLNLPNETMESKIYDDKKFWHRMGDVGYIDENNYLWFLGRKAHLVETKEGVLTPISCEAIFNSHPRVKRSALVGIGEKGKQIPAIVIELKDGLYLRGKEKSLLENELLLLGHKYAHTAAIKKIYFSRSFPVDVRHNIKIDRLKLAKGIQTHDAH